MGYFPAGVSGPNQMVVLPSAFTWTSPLRLLTLGDAVFGQVEDLVLVGILDAVERMQGGLRPLDFKTAASRAGYDASSLAAHLQGSIYGDTLRRLHRRARSAVCSGKGVLEVQSEAGVGTDWFW